MLFCLLYFISFVVSFFIIRLAFKINKKEILDMIPIAFILIVLFVPFANIIYSLLIITTVTDVKIVESFVNKLFFLKEKATDDKK